MTPTAYDDLSRALSAALTYPDPDERASTLGLIAACLRLDFSGYFWPAARTTEAQGLAFAAATLLDEAAETLRREGDDAPDDLSDTRYH